jgi:hypothetical protein
MQCAPSVLLGLDVPTFLKEHSPANPEKTLLRQTSTGDKEKLFIDQR